MEILLTIVTVILLISVIKRYNSLIQARNQVTQAFGTIDVMLKRRYDLIPNLVATVQKYMEHEKGTLERVVELRNKFQNATLEDKVAIDQETSRLVKSIMVTVENYPDLKSSTNMLELQKELADTEDEIAAARRFFNTTVTVYNTEIQVFPTNLIASLMGFKQMAVFQITAEIERKVVQVKDLF